MPRRTATWSQLGNIFPSTSQSKWPSRMNHPVDGIDPEGSRRVCTRAYVCAFVHVRMCTRARSRRSVRTRCLVDRPEARLRLSSANEFRFSAWGAMGCHVKLHRRAFLSHSHVYTRPPLKTRVPRGRTRSRVCPGWADPCLPTCPRNCRERSLVGCWVCRPRFRLRIAKRVGQFFPCGRPSADSVAHSRSFARTWKELRPFFFVRSG